MREIAGRARYAALVVGLCAVTYLTVTGYAQTSSLTFPYGKYLLPLVLGLDALLLVWWWPPSAIYIALAAQVSPSLGGTSLAAIGTLLLLVVAIGRSWRPAGRTAQQGGMLIVILAFSSLVPGLAFTGTHGTGGVPHAMILAATLGVCAAVSRLSRQALLAPVIAVGSLASYDAIGSAALRTNRNIVILGENANGIGMLAALGLVGSLVALKELRDIQRLLAAGTAVLCASGVVASGSRGALLAVAAGIAALLGIRFISGPPLRAVVAVSVSVIVIYMAAGPLFGQLLKLSGRQASGAANNLVSRQDALDYAIQAGLHHPLFGVGLNRLAEVSHADPKSGLGLSAHDVFAGLFAECGVVALFALVLLSAVALTRSRRPGLTGGFPLVVTVLVSGLSLQWWGAGLTGAMSLLILGAAVAGPPLSRTNASHGNCSPVRSIEAESCD